MTSRASTDSESYIQYDQIYESENISGHFKHSSSQPRRKILLPKYNQIFNVECLAGYHPGGYHPIELGDVVKNRYKILDKLGYGRNSTVWLARDRLFQCYVAVKINVSGAGGHIPHDGRSPKRTEADILRNLEKSLVNGKLSRILLEGSKAIPKVLGQFSIVGPNGTHYCLVMALQRQNLYSVSLGLERRFKMQVARVLAAKLVAAVAVLHGRGTIHGDIFLKNILTGLPKTIDQLTEEELKAKFGDPESHAIHRKDGRPLNSEVPRHGVVPMSLGLEADNFTVQDAKTLLLVNYGEAWAPDEETRKGYQCVGPVCKRPPEAYFEPEEALTFASDVWRLGLTLWDLFADSELFGKAKSHQQAIAEQITLFGVQSLPKVWREMWKGEGYYAQHSPDARPPQTFWTKLGAIFARVPAAAPLEGPFESLVQGPRREVEEGGVFCEQEKKAFIALLQGMLEMDPRRRWTIDVVMRSQWIAHWAVPELLLVSDVVA